MQEPQKPLLQPKPTERTIKIKTILSKTQASKYDILTLHTVTTPEVVGKYDTYNLEKLESPFPITAETVVIVSKTAIGRYDIKKAIAPNHEQEVAFLKDVKTYLEVLDTVELVA